MKTSFLDSFSEGLIPPNHVCIPIPSHLKYFLRDLFPVFMIPVKIFPRKVTHPPVPGY